MAAVQLIRVVLVLCLLGTGTAMAASPQYRNLESVGLRRLPNGDFEVTRTSRYQSWIKGLWEGKTGSGGARELIRESTGKMRLGGGQASDVPYRMKMSGPKKGSAGAARTFGKFAFKNGGRALLGPAGALLTGLELLQWGWNLENERWERPGEEGVDYYESQGWEFYMSAFPDERYPTPEAACKGATGRPLGRNNEDYWVYVSNSRETCFVELRKYDDPSVNIPTHYSIKSRVLDSCPAGRYLRWPDLTCVDDIPMVPVPEPEFLEEVPTDDITEDVANDLDEILDWPFYLPEIAPTWVPASDPVPNPQHDPTYDPSQDPDGLDRYKLPYIQPGTMITPANTPYEPWRVNIQPWDIYLDDPTGIRQPVPRPWPDVSPWDPPEWWKWPFPDPFGGDQGGPAEGSEGHSGQQPLLCEVFPDISACAKLGTVDPDELGQEEITIDIDPQDWGGPGACPAPIELSVMGQAYYMEWTPICTLASRSRPLVLAFAWLAAALAVGGWGRSSS